MSMRVSRGRSVRPVVLLLAACGSVALVGVPATSAQQSAPAAEKKPDFPAFADTIKDLTKVVSTADGADALWELYSDKETGRLLAVLPANYEKQMVMIACTVSGGDPQAGVMGPTHYVKWERYDKQLALLAPDLSVRTDGDQQAKDSIAELYKGRVILSTPIVSMAPGNRPVIDLGAIATKDAGKLFGNSIFGGYGANMNGLDARLAKLTKAKAFPNNIVVEYQAPAAGGQLLRVAYSIGNLDGSKGFKPRKADPRVGYFYDSHQDFARTANQDVTDRYITRWNLEKADDSLAMSPAKQPVVWYIEHTTPIKFRRYVRDGVLAWNKAFEKVGILDAMVVYQQDAATGAHMDKDPEDARYNFFRWNASDQGYAIGPSRTNPFTGEILDADVVWHQGLTRSIRGMLENISDDLVAEAFGPETLAWLDENPNFDPRVRLAAPEKREAALTANRVRLAAAEAHEPGSQDHPWAGSARDHTNHACRIGNRLSVDMSLASAALAAGMLKTDDTTDMLDGLPEEFIGQMIRYISAHEVGHCLGLQHNMAASSIHTLEEINSPGFTGPMIGSVMDYAAVNLNHDLGPVQGPYASTEVGPYDDWAIAFGYGPEKAVADTLKRVSEPDNIFISQPAIGIGSDPRNQTWELGKDNLTFAESRLGIVKELRSKILTDIVDDGESWAMARRKYQALLGTHLSALFVAAPWIGGTYTNNDFKGDPGARPPIEDVPADHQRRALALIMDNAFEDDAFGLTPDLLRHLGKEYWWDPQGLGELAVDPSYTAHDMVGGVQATALTLIMNPTRLRRLYDNELRAPDNALTLAEVVRSVTDRAWNEALEPRAAATSSFRRNLQREHAERLIALALPKDTVSPSMRAISTLARAELTRIREAADAAKGKSGDVMTDAHLADVIFRIDRAMDATVVVPR